MEANKLSMVSIGQKLKEARGRKNVTLIQAQQQTHIHSTVLTALEDGRCDEILTATYVKSFLKKYATYLGLDARQCLSEYAALHPEDNNQIVKTQSLESKDIKSPLDLSKTIDIARKVLIVMVVLFAAIFLWKKMVEYIKRPKPVSVVRAVNKKAKRSNEKTGQKKESQKEKNKELEGLTQISIPKKEPLSLVLRTNRSVLVRIKKDGVLMFRSVLPKNTVETITADDSINIYVAKAEAIDLTLNGKAMGSPGRGIINDLEITRKGVKAK
jgi:cytoskeletal protein RodZ